LRKTRHPLKEERLLEGTFFGIIAATLGAMVFVSIVEALIASIVAMTVESIELELGKHPIDDNILIPLVAGLTILLTNLLL